MNDVPLEIFAPDLSGNLRVVCPVCGFECIHPVRVRVFPVGGDTEYEITADGLSMGGSTAAEHQRGVSIVVGFVCENGDAFDVEFRFHKGATSIYAYTHDVDAHGCIRTIWRN